jgi:hypothetical protein
MPGTLAPGRYYQLYCDAIHPGELDSGLVQVKNADPDSKVVWHKFPTDLGASYDALAKKAADHGLPSGGAIGLDEHAISAETKGDAVGDVASRSNCLVMLVDCEGYYDTGRKAEMKTLGQRARAKAPQALIIAQPWPEPLEHSGFPYEEENDFVDVNAPQYYFNDWTKPLGSTRVEHLQPVFDRQWAVLNGQIPTDQLANDKERQNSGRLAACVRPGFWTIQSEGWDDIIWELITILLTHPAILVWCDKGLPRSSAWWVALQAITTLAKDGFIGPRAVWDYQAANPSLGAPDGKAGPKTLALLGIAWHQPGV